jgi:DNA-binding transcriptional LysR family regulator
LDYVIYNMLAALQENGSVSRAAKRVHLTQSALSIKSRRCKTITACR